MITFLAISPGSSSKHCLNSTAETRARKTSDGITDIKNIKLKNLNIKLAPVALHREAVITNACW